MFSPEMLCFNVVIMFLTSGRGSQLQPLLCGVSDDYVIALVTTCYECLNFEFMFFTNISCCNLTCDVLTLSSCFFLLLFLLCSRHNMLGNILQIASLSKAALGPEAVIRPFNPFFYMHDRYHFLLFIYIFMSVYISLLFSLDSLG